MDENSVSCSDVSINPFEAESTDSLHLSKFSPSIFKIKTPSSTKKSPKFRWSIDQLAILKPADIDETPQQDTNLDQDTEQRLQQAIDQFFSQKQVAPSPWSSGKLVKHVTFSPHPPSTNYYESADNSGASSCDTSFTNNKPNMVDASSQTCLTLPLDFDLHALLSSFYSYQQGSMNEILSTSSLRRKLFLPAGSMTSESSPSMNYIQSSQCESGVFPEKLLSLSPINSVKQRATAPGRDTPNTPASAKSQFSSSPKSTPSSKKYHSLVSSDIDSPLISPIKMDLLENLSDNNRVWMHPIENTPCGKTKFYLPPPGISPIPCFSGNASTLGSSCKGKENKFGSMPKKSNLKVPSSGNLPRGAVAKLNLMTVLDRHAGCTTNKYLKEVNMQTPVSKISKEVLMPEMLLPIEPVLDSNTEKREVSDKEHQDLQMASSATTGYENQRKLSQVDASMLDFDASPDTFDSDTNAAKEYLTSTMRKDYFSEVPKEKREECSFPVNSLSENDVGCHLNAVQKYLTSTMRNDYFSEMAKCNENNEEFSFPVNSLTENDDGCFLGKESAVDMSFCPENEMDISQESLLLPESDHRLGTPVSECNNMPSLNSISGHNQPIDSGVNGMTNSGSIQDDCKMASERCDMEMSMIEGGYNANTPPASTLPV